MIKTKQKETTIIKPNDSVNVNQNDTNHSAVLNNDLGRQEAASIEHYSICTTSSSIEQVEYTATNNNGSICTRDVWIQVNQS